MIIMRSRLGMWVLVASLCAALLIQLADSRRLANSRADIIAPAVSVSQVEQVEVVTPAYIVPRITEPTEPTFPVRTKKPARISKPSKQARQALYRSR